MAGSVRKIMAYLGLVDDEYDDYDDLSDRSRSLPPRSAPTRAPRPDPRDREYDREPEDYYADRPEPSRMAPVTRIRPMNAEGQPVAGPGRSSVPASSRPTMLAKTASESARVHVVAPLRFADAKEIGDFIRQTSPVIVNLQGADRDLQRRMIDFCSGIAYAVGCSMERVADQVFLLTPDEVTVSAEERARLARRGFNRDD
jgi:cell division inhibitor SepF